MSRSGIKEFFGLQPQEYVCVAFEDMSDSPSVIMTSRKSLAFADVTSAHVLLGYKQVVIAVALNNVSTEIQNAREVCFTFTHEEFGSDVRWHGFTSASSGVARLELSRIQDGLSIPGIGFFVAKSGEQNFLPVHQALANRMSEALRRKPASEANVSANQYDQVRIAYCVPRRIAVITVMDGDLLNFFPTDLHGNGGDGYYLSSLRIGGMACSQVEHVKRVVISSVDVKAFKETYGLGKNHMKELKPAGEFKPAFRRSQSGIPVYPSATSYLELEIVKHWDAGIHRIFLYKVVEAAEATPGKTLAHIHAYYAQWRTNHNFSAEYFYR
jgi:hypothetical protein